MNSQPMTRGARLQRGLAVAVVGAITAGTAALIAGIAISARRDAERRDPNRSERLMELV